PVVPPTTRAVRVGSIGSAWSSSTSTVTGTVRVAVPPPATWRASVTLPSARYVCAAENVSPVGPSAAGELVPSPQNTVTLGVAPPPANEPENVCDWPPTPVNVTNPAADESVVTPATGPLTAVMTGPPFAAVRVMVKVRAALVAS